MLGSRCEVNQYPMNIEELTIKDRGCTENSLMSDSDLDIHSSRHRQSVQERFTHSLVSIIIPTYNRSHYLKEMICSLTAQTYRPIEIIVVDDGSTDDTFHMMMEAKQELREAQIDCIYAEQIKSNGNRARNTGFKLSRGDYIVFMDSDDYAHPEIIARMVEVLEQTDSDFSVCDSQRFHYQPGDTSEIKRLSSRRHDAWSHINAIALQTWFLAKRSVITAIGPWDDDLTHRQDVEYTFRILINRFRGTWIPDVLYYWRMHESQMSNRTDESVVASSLLALTKMANYAKLKGRYTWLIRIAFGREYSRLAYLCHRFGYATLARQAEQLANRECPGILIPFYIYRIIRQVLDWKVARIFKCLFKRANPLNDKPA